MPFNLVAAIIAGLVSTLVISAMMAMGPRMGMPEMDMPAMLGSMFGAPPNKALGWVMHLMLGALFAIVYALLFPVVGGNIIALGAVFGVAHWLVVGLVMGMMPMMHAGIRSGEVAEPGVYMLRQGGAMGFVGGLMGHIVYGLVVGIVYGLVAGGFAA